MQPKDNEATTYVTSAFCDGTQPLNVSARAFTPDRHAYDSCITLQYGYKPASNSTVITIQPQATQAAVPTKTPEEMQKEAEQNGTLRIWHEFSWWFPWYRLHFVSMYAGVDQYDQGISPIPLVGATLSVSDAFMNTLRSLWIYVVWPIAASVAVAEFAALLASNLGILGFVGAILLSLAMKFGPLYLNWNSIGGLAAAAVGNLFSTVVGMLKWSWNFVTDFIKLLMDNIGLTEFGLGNLYRIFSFASSIFYLSTIFQRLHELGAIP